MLRVVEMLLSVKSLKVIYTVEYGVCNYLLVLYCNYSVVPLRFLRYSTSIRGLIMCH